MDDWDTSGRWSLHLALGLAERDLVPETLLRAGIRRLLLAKLRAEQREPRREALLAELESGPITPVASRATTRPDVPVSFFKQVLGSHLSTSSAYWADDIATLDDAEAAMLSLICKRAELTDGQRVLDLGCGWGALSIWMARRYPESRVVAVTDSVTQQAAIEARRPANLEVITSEMGDFTTGRRFDRIVSVDAFPRLRNWKLLLHRIAGWLAHDGSLFLHLFCHSRHLYPLSTPSAGGWLERHFLTGAIMPSSESIEHVTDDWSLAERWSVSGQHYARTAEAWRVNLEARRERVLPILQACYGKTSAMRWFYRWRLLFLVCSELFGFGAGREWHVSHYRFTKPA